MQEGTPINMTQLLIALEAMTHPTEIIAIGVACVTLRLDSGERRWWVNRGEAAGRMAKSPRRAAFYVMECLRWDKSIHKQCGKKYFTVTSAERASSEGCTKCGGVDIDLDIGCDK